MAVLWTILILVFFAIAFDGAFRRGVDDPSWELHWRSLDVVGRARIATAANKRDAYAALAAPDDLALAAGYRRRRRRRRAYLELAVSPFFIIAAALSLNGLLSASLLGFIFGVFTLCIGLWAYLRERQMDGRLRAVVDAEAPTGVWHLACNHQIDRNLREALDRDHHY